MIYIDLILKIVRNYTDKNPKLVFTKFGSNGSLWSLKKSNEKSEFFCEILCDHLNKKAVLV